MQNKLISTADGFFIALLVTKDNRQCGDLLDRLRLQKEVINSTTTLTMIVELDQPITNVFLTFPVYFPILLNFGILIICGGACFIVQQYCTREIILNRSEPSERFQEVSLSDFNKTFGKRKSLVRSTYFGKMTLVVAIFFAIP